MSNPTPEAKRAVEMIMREFHHASGFVMEQHVQQALDAITDKSLKLFADALAEKDKVIEGFKLRVFAHEQGTMLLEKERDAARGERDDYRDKFNEVICLNASLAEELANHSVVYAARDQAEEARDELVGIAGELKSSGKALRDYFIQKREGWSSAMTDAFDRAETRLDTLLARIDAKGEKP